MNFKDPPFTEVAANVSQPAQWSITRQDAIESVDEPPSHSAPKASHAAPFLELRITELEAENAELRKDAERYRWLRDHNGIHGYGVQVAISRPIDKDVFWVHCDSGLDAAIDAAIVKIQEAP